jgi:RNAse (barnase) inhibitor barstar
MGRRRRAKAANPKKVNMANEGVAGKNPLDLKGVPMRQPEAVVRRNGTFNKTTMMYLQTVPINRLDGLWDVVSSKVKELGVPAGKHKVVKVVGEPSGSLAAVMKYVRQVADGDDYSDLQAIHSVLSSRFKASGYTPKPSDVE